MKKIIIILTLLLLATNVFAIQIGQAPTKLEIGELKRGEKISLPNLVVFNPNEEDHKYKMEMINLSEAEVNVNFSPSKFNIKAGQSRIVKSKLSVDKNAKAGEYKIYLASSPIQEDAEGMSLAPLVATTLRFEILKGRYNTRDRVRDSLASIGSLFEWFDWKTLLFCGVIFGGYFGGSSLLKRRRKV